MKIKIGFDKNNVCRFRITVKPIKTGKTVLNGYHGTSSYRNPNSVNKIK